ncbi:gfo/Idh/MocA family oxidoreductase [Clostridioides difficile]|nr:gfo/Idh/MocA family oxidoreductase [Clostridioides difficile]MCI9997161.1 Gfo/Idh/MocA family oxidoreductase [Clostridioides difficile]
MKNIKVGMIGLGSIAQKAYLPILTKSERFEFVGAFTPNKIKREKVCSDYRIMPFDSIESLAKKCDCIFLHSSTETHYEIIKILLNLGVHVYVDKPLASTVNQGEELIELSTKKKLNLMVGFNRRFCPMYKEIKNNATEIVSINICKHGLNSLRNVRFDSTLIDDYIHVIDTALWLANEDVEISGEDLFLTDNKNLIFVSHKLKGKHFSINTSMHRDSGTKLEQVEILSKGKIQRVKNLNVLEIEESGNLTLKQSGAWVNILKQKGFEDISNHFINCIENNIKPTISGEECIKAQRLLEKIISSVK